MSEGEGEDEMRTLVSLDERLDVRKGVDGRVVRFSLPDRLLSQQLRRDGPSARVAAAEKETDLVDLGRSEELLLLLSDVEQMHS